MSKEGLRVNGCDNASRIHFQVYGALAVSMLPFTIWCCYKHIKMHYSTSTSDKHLFRISIGVYLCTTLWSILGAITSFGVCHLSPDLWFNIWRIQRVLWILQWFCFISLLFTRYTSCITYIYIYITRHT